MDATMGRRHGWMLLVAGLWGCVDRQETHLVLADYTAEARVPGGTVVAGSDRHDGFEFRQLGLSVPLIYEWNVARDADGCLQPARLRVQRTGGDSRLVIDSVVAMNGECWRSQVDSLPWASAPVFVHYRGRRGMSTSSGNVIIGRLLGTGAFMPH
jgi:hypothetical protein